ncbi:hypothetical protein DFO66_104245 [Brevibacterium sanguinis]|uniref:DUF503 domain-containing protein n=2 Tax=Brevibacterium TaxID=1696 RepID=A0A366IM69_9MICO|nr:MULTISPECIES: DUF503 domain-containing protein [Brevibacterium]RBP65659.1 hypothetical protein DFO66_104245 [Brevibacterium sanguinis]RBP72293.1 hypothetical protein DFO65_104251 [Brevibacterium celere]
MWIGWIEFDLRLGDVHSLKAKRAVVRPILAGIRRRHDVSVAEVDHLDLYRRAAIGVGLVAADSGRVVEILDQVERYVAELPEVELLSARRQLRSSDD